MPVLDIARAFFRRQQTLSRRAAAEVDKLWRLVDRRAIRASWVSALPAVLTVVESAQAIAAASAGAYLDDLLEEYRLPPGADGRVVVSAFAGVASDGRALDTLMLEPAIAALTALKQGRSQARALATGRFAVDTIVRTQVTDAGRTATGVALAARRQLPGYVRMLSTPSCARCVILAGRMYRWNAGFARHPRCDCRHIPSPEDVAGDLRTDPGTYFASLDPAEQNRLFTAAGAQAIRDGADINKVVNARRGVQTADVFGQATQITAEAARRGVRLMPEAIYRLADGDRDEAIRLLKRHGYLT